MKKVTGTILIILGTAAAGFGVWLLLQAPSSTWFFCLSIIGFGIALIISGILVCLGKNFWKVIEDIFYTLP